MSGIETVLSALDENGLRYRFSGGQYLAQCPVHDDRTPSLAIKAVAGKVLLHCHTGCRAADIVEAFGLSWSDVSPPPERRDEPPGAVASYYYNSADGTVLYRKNRTAAKRFWFEHPVGAGWEKGRGAEAELYNLVALLQAVRDEMTVWIVEGEKDANAAIALGLVATCNDDGAAQPGDRSKWRSQYARHFKDARVRIVADRDKAGIAHAQAIMDSLTGVAESVEILLPAVDRDKADLSDHLNAGFTIDELVPFSDPDFPESKGQNRHNPSGDVVASLLSPSFEESWDQPLTLEWITEAIPVDALGDIVGPFVLAVAESLQVHSDMVASVVLPTIATAIRGRITVRIKADWTETIALSTTTVAASAERKSGVHRLVVRPLSEHEAEQKEETRSVIAEERAELQFAQEHADQLKKAALKSGDPIDKQHYLEAVKGVSETAANMTPIPRWIASDATPEAIVRLLADHGAVGVLSSEPGLFAIMAGRYSGGRRNVETVLQATSGDPIIVDRADGEKSISVDRPALSASMCIQTGRLTELNLPEFIESGLLARLLFTMAPSMVGYRRFRVEQVPPATLKRWSDALKALANADIRREIRLTGDAAEALELFGEEIEPELRRHEGSLAGIGSWAGKLPGQVARIAAALTLLSNPDAVAIEKPGIEAAIRIGRAYTTHALAAFAVIRQRDDRLNQAQAVMHTVLRKKCQTFTVRELLRAVQGQAWVDGVDDLTVPLQVLVERGHIRAVVKDDTPKSGRPASASYKVNPAHFLNPSVCSDKTDKTPPVTSFVGFVTAKPVVQNLKTRGVCAGCDETDRDLLVDDSGLCRVCFFDSIQRDSA